MARRLHKTLLDYLVIAISPALIIVLVDSLVLFLIEVFYRGNFQGRLRIRLHAVRDRRRADRPNLDRGRTRAGRAVRRSAGHRHPAGHQQVRRVSRALLASFSFFINCGLIALVWWSADKLTWDCTLIDEQEEDSGEGLLETVGLDRPDQAAVQREIAPAQAGTRPRRPPRGTNVPTSWWDRFVERRRRPHAPGVWVVYFSLAALPLFGIGQLFIPSRQSGGPAVCVPTSLRLHGQRTGAAAFDELSRPAPLSAAATAGNAAGDGQSLAGHRRGLDRRRDVRGDAPAAAQRRIRRSRSSPFHIGSPDQNALALRHRAAKASRRSSRTLASKPATTQSRTRRSRTSPARSTSADGKKSAKERRRNRRTTTARIAGSGKDQKESADKNWRKRRRQKVEESREISTASSQRSGEKQPADDQSQGKDGQVAPIGTPRRRGEAGGGFRHGRGETARETTARSAKAAASIGQLRRERRPAATVVLRTASLLRRAVQVDPLHRVGGACRAMPLWKNRAELLAALRDFRQMRWPTSGIGCSAEKPRAGRSGGRRGRQAKAVAAIRRFHRPVRGGHGRTLSAEGVGADTRSRPWRLGQETTASPGCPSRRRTSSPDRLASSVSSMADDARHLAELYCQVGLRPRHAVGGERRAAVASVAGDASGCASCRAGSRRDTNDGQNLAAARLATTPRISRDRRRIPRISAMLAGIRGARFSALPMLGASLWPALGLCLSVRVGTAPA